MIKKKRCLLLSPSVFYCPYFGGSSQHGPHFDSLEAAVQKDAFVQVVDLTRILGKPCNEEQIKLFLRDLKNILKNMPKYDIVGISCYTSYNYLSTIKVATLIRQLWPDSTIVVGGYHPTAVPEDFIYENTPFDFIVQGEGEDALRHILLQDIIGHNIPQIIIGKQLDPDEWPTISYKNYPHNSDFIFIETSRGCYMKCKFCPQSANTSLRWRALPPSKALDNVKRAYHNIKPKNIGFIDPCFGFNQKWGIEFLKGLKSLSLPVTYWAECRVDNVHDDELDIMARLNFRIYFGVESLSCRTIKIMGKAINPKLYIEKTISTVGNCIQKDIPCQIGFIMNYPGETLESFRETTDNLGNLIESFSYTSLDLDGKIFTPYPGNELFRNRKEYENKYGFQVEEPYWWRKATPKLLDLSIRTIGSEQLLNRYGFSPYWWTKDWYRIEKKNVKKLSMRAYTFQGFGMIDKLKNTFSIKNVNIDNGLIVLLWKVDKVFKEILIDWNIILGYIEQYSQVQYFSHMVKKSLMKKRWEFIKSTTNKLYNNSQSKSGNVDAIMAECKCLRKNLKHEIEENHNIVTKSKDIMGISLKIDGKMFRFKNMT